MLTRNRILFTIMIISTGCNTNSNNTNSTNQQDRSTKQLVGSNSDSISARANDSVIHAKLNLVKIDNLDCPVCRKPMSKGIEDTVTYACMLYGFDSKQCREEFSKKPDKYKVNQK